MEVQVFLRVLIALRSTQAPREGSMPMLILRVMLCSSARSLYAYLANTMVCDPTLLSLLFLNMELKDLPRFVIVDGS